jgi:hypothetical protein
VTDKRKRPSDTEPADIRTQGEAKVIGFPGTQDTPPQEDFLAHIVSGAAIAGMPAIEWLLKRLIPKRGTVAIYAPPKSGKSVVANELAISAALGETFWQVPFTKPLTVLYIAAERAEDIADRMKATLQRRGVPYPPNLHLYYRPAGPLQVEHGAHFKGLLQVVEHLKPDLIIFDTFARMTLGLEENNSAEMGEAVEAFNAVIRAAGPNCAGVLVHHAGKDRTKGLRGSTALLGAVDAVWAVVREETREGQANYRLEVEAMNAGATPPPEHFTIVGEVIEGREESTPVLVWRAFADFASERDRWIVETLNAAGEKGLSKAEVTALYNEHHRTEYAAATVYGWLRNLVGRSQIEQPEGPKSSTRYFGKGFAPK